MLTISHLFSDEAKQQITVDLPDGAGFNIILQYQILTEAWYCDIIYSRINFSLRGIRLTNNINILRPFEAKLNFGISFILTDGGESWYQNDFISKRVQVFLLDKNDIANINNAYNS